MSDDPILKRRSLWIAGLLTLVQTGLGQWYNTQWRKAIGFLCLETVVGFLLLTLVMRMPVAHLNVILPVAVILGLKVFFITDAVRAARRTASQPAALRCFNRWYVYLAIWGVAAFVVLPHVAYGYRNSVAEAFAISASAMNPTLTAGDRVVADKWALGLREPIHGRLLTRWAMPQRQQVVIYHRAGEAVNYVGRVVALPGDKFEVRNHIAWINGQKLDEPYALTEDQVYPHPFPQFGPVDVPESQYAILGDNRPNSNDSRMVGFIAEDDIIAIVKCIYYSTEPSRQSDVAGYGLPDAPHQSARLRFRWERFGKLIE